jgi:hypothetical protein
MSLRERSWEIMPGKLSVYRRPSQAEGGQALAWQTNAAKRTVHILSKRTPRPVVSLHLCSILLFGTVRTVRTVYRRAIPNEPRHHGKSSTGGIPATQRCQPPRPSTHRTASLCSRRRTIHRSVNPCPAQRYGPAARSSRRGHAGTVQRHLRAHSTRTT